MTSDRARLRLVEQLQTQGIKNQRILNIINHIPRHIFIEEAMRTHSYDNKPLPIGYNQTISQPYIVARMTEVLIEEGIPSHVLEVGTGSGYQTAVLSQLVDRVYSVERILGLHQFAQARIKELELTNTRLYHTDGIMGLPNYAPYDGIIVTAAPQGIPLELIEQLKIGAAMILPVGDESEQILIKIIKTATGYNKKFIEKVKFVPLLSGLLNS